MAYSGATASHLKHYADIALLDSPESIIIHGGTNDIYGRNSNQKSADAIATELIQTGEKARNSGVKNIYISSILPIADNEAYNRGLDINEFLKSYCYTYNFGYIDNSNLTVYDLKENDPVHLSLDGRWKLISNFVDFLNQY